MTISLEDRMKMYESSSTDKLPDNFPIIIRIDGRAFHTFTRGFDKPYSEQFIDLMNNVGLSLCNEISSCKLAYLQSDEISFLVWNSKDQSTYFNYDIQKLASITASMASSVGMRWKYKNNIKPDTLISFDSRAFIIPPHDIDNYFIWRQRDWERNSLQMLCRKYYSQKQMQKKNNSDMHEMIFQKGDNWDKLSTYLKRGRCIVRKIERIEIDNEYFKGEVDKHTWVVDNEIPIFTKDREYIKSRYPEW